MRNAIELHQVSKKFNKLSGQRNTIKDIVTTPAPAAAKDKWVLRDIELEIPKGTSLALIGKNGSGKSTLLKLISRILQPTSGRVKVSGKVATLLELGAGFHADFTGRENIYFNGSVLGFTRKEIHEKMDSIIEFSELGEDIDRLVRGYSTGMYMRLGFSVAIHMTPDILLIDEVLAVGDHEFQKKCINAILRLKSAGTTIVFVSHAGEQATIICDQAIWLEEGRIKLSGPTRDVVMAYEQSAAAHDYLAEYYYRMGCRSQQQKDFEKALKFFDQSLDKNYNEFSVKILRSSVYLELGMQEEAGEDAIRCLEIAPPGTDMESVVQHVHFVNSKRDVEWVASARTKLFDNAKTEPAFLIIGTQKGGTTSLYHDLTQHPGIKSAAVKEVHFFDEQYHFGYDWYKKNFPPDLPEGSITGEASPYYMFHPQTPGRVREWLPDVKLIALLRNPVHRAYSHYQMMVRRGLEPMSFPDALQAERSRVEEEYERMSRDPRFSSQNCSIYSYLKRGLYAEQLERWYRYFPKNQILVMNSEVLLRDAAESYRNVLAFLGMPLWEPDGFASLNEGEYKESIPKDTMQWLRSYYAEPNRRLFELIGEEYDWD
ncbi:ATP-binding cassette domain-containing protein [Paenibacillus lutrae]|uniref:ATP-binding cassette domain-containing protein n=1 Tax=Paenibacillus lutrae TaxID=2078573 RepID=A0A7X3FEW4_9BACL|nr:ATP-binding cassette domain-containing protein [Paenibacillus lutrae]MVO98218.1 ATP-binding cassette domain-containing protein [Paenibacillus lutrae]